MNHAAYVFEWIHTAYSILVLKSKQRLYAVSVNNIPLGFLDAWPVTYVIIADLVYLQMFQNTFFRLFAFIFQLHIKCGGL